MNSRRVQQIAASVLTFLGVVWFSHCSSISPEWQRVGSGLMAAGVVWLLIARRMLPARDRGFDMVVAKPGAMPAATSTVEFDEESVRCHRSDGRVEAIRWSQLEAVMIRTTDEGPGVDDMFWWLVGQNTGCVVPSEAAGMDELLKRLQRLPGFDNEAVIQAMTCTDDKQFVCWKREDHQPQ